MCCIFSQNETRGHDVGYFVVMDSCKQASRKNELWDIDSHKPINVTWMSRNCIPWFLYITTETKFQWKSVHYNKDYVHGNLGLESSKVKNVIRQSFFSFSPPLFSFNAFGLQFLIQNLWCEMCFLKSFRNVKDSMVTYPYISIIGGASGTISEYDCKNRCEHSQSGVSNNCTYSTDTLVVVWYQWVQVRSDWLPRLPVTTHTQSKCCSFGEF